MLFSVCLVCGSFPTQARGKRKGGCRREEDADSEVGKQNEAHEEGQTEGTAEGSGRQSGREDTWPLAEHPHPRECIRLWANRDPEREKHREREGQTEREKERDRDRETERRRDRQRQETENREESPMSPSLLDLRPSPRRISALLQTWVSAGEFQQWLCTQSLALTPHLPWHPQRKETKI